MLLLHANGLVAPARRLPFAAQWLQRRRSEHVEPRQQAELAPSHAGEADAGTAATRLAGPTRSTTGQLAAPQLQRERRQLERSQRMRAGLIELDRWLADRVRQGLAAPDFADRATWDRLAQRLVDAQCASLANRVKRVAGRIGQHPRWQEDLLEELAVLHLLAVAAQHTSTLEPQLSDGVHAATGLNVAKDEVLAGVPTTTHWLVVGESRTREDRITVQRTWLCSAQIPTTWAMVLAFGAFGNEVVTEHPVGGSFHGDVHWYPGGLRLRALVGHLNDVAGTAPPPPTSTIGEALHHAGWAIAQEPWLERYPMCVLGAPRTIGAGRWTLADHTGSLRLDPGFAHLSELVSICGGRAAAIMGEHSTEGFLPLTVWSHAMAVLL